MMKTIYPALFHKEDGSYWVEFPDLEGCFSDGDSIAEALSNAEESLAAYCASILEHGGSLPAASDIISITVPENCFPTLVEATLKSKGKAVKKTLTIPDWLNDLAVERGINFSGVLQNALMRELNIS